MAVCVCCCSPSAAPSFVTLTVAAAAAALEAETGETWGNRGLVHVQQGLGSASYSPPPPPAPCMCMWVRWGGACRYQCSPNRKEPKSAFSAMPNWLLDDFSLRFMSLFVQTDELCRLRKTWLIRFLSGDSSQELGGFMQIASTVYMGPRLHLKLVRCWSCPHQPPPPAPATLQLRINHVIQLHTLSLCSHLLPPPPSHPLVHLSGPHRLLGCNRIYCALTRTQRKHTADEEAQVPEM